MDMSQEPFCAMEKCRTLIPGHTFRASLRSRNADGHFRRAIFWKFRGKMPEPQLIEHQALTETVRTPSVWPHCLGKKRTCLVSRHEGRQGWIVSQHLSPSICMSLHGIQSNISDKTFSFISNIPLLFVARWPFQTI